MSKHVFVNKRQLMNNNNKKMLKHKLKYYDMTKIDNKIDARIGGAESSKAGDGFPDFSLPWMKIEDA